MSDATKALYDELHEAQKSRDVLLKWKLTIVSGVGAAGLGLTEGDAMPNAYLVLSVIPLACVYVDLLCRNLSIRTKSITAFLATESENNYEIFYRDFVRHRGDSFESVALLWSTIVLSFAIVAVGNLVASDGGYKSPFIVSGVAGVVCSLLVEWEYQACKKRLKEFVAKRDSKLAAALKKERVSVA